jgi:DNA-binding response OmpR family regulator
MRKRILSISYDTVLLHTRRMLLEEAGFEVVSASSFRQAFDLCRAGDFDLLIIGHSIPPSDKASMIAAARKSSGAPVLSIRNDTEPAVPGADYSVYGLEGPKVLLEAVNESLHKAQERKQAERTITNGHSKTGS